MIPIGYNVDFPPFAWREGDKACGTIIDRTREAAEYASLEIDFVPLPLDHLRSALEDRAIDAICGYGVTPGRLENLALSSPLVETGGAWFVRRTTTWPEEDRLRAGDHAPLRAASPVSGPLFAQIESCYPRLTAVGVETYADALAAALNGDADAAALNFHVGRMIATRDHPELFRLPEQPFLQIPLALAALDSAHGRDLIERLNIGLADHSPLE